MPRRRSRSPRKTKSIVYKGKVQNDSPAVFPRTYTKSTSPKRRNILSRTLQNDHILPDGSYLDSKQTLTITTSSNSFLDPEI
ncbi:hypothetical protein BLNAU_19589 [Blattamonas nauphoetae]|uniref:Uncharacterized protein n=1 Tax=Blattamonas nauphoetae TaxID=2049346 RepID=A0ABQ9X157_9EUKA|nr:hypothetical protein BLNAU_19589 [Blattamonas nauphoetae]